MTQPPARRVAVAAAAAATPGQNGTEADRQQQHQPEQQGQRQSASRPPVRVGDQLELECARLALEGKGVCLLPPSGYVVLVERSLPGEVLLAEVTAVKRGYAEARKLAVLSPHRHSVHPPCPYFGPCGGCTMQSLDYAAQLEEKRAQVEQTLRRVGKLGPSLDRIAAAAAVTATPPSSTATAEATVAPAAAAAGEPLTAAGPSTGAAAAGGVGRSAAGNAASAGGGGGAVASTVGCHAPFAYRNKMMFHFSSRCWLPAEDRVVEDRSALGLLRPGTPDVVLPVTQHGCKLQGSVANALLARVEQLVSERGLLPYNDPSGQGTLKHLVIRRGSGAAAATPALPAPPSEPPSPEQHAPSSSAAEATPPTGAMIVKAEVDEGVAAPPPLAAHAAAAEGRGTAHAPVCEEPSPEARPAHAVRSSTTQGVEGAAEDSERDRKRKQQEQEEEEERKAEYMLVFGVTRGSAVERLRPLADALAKEFPQLVSIGAQLARPPVRADAPKASANAAGGRGGQAGRAGSRRLDGARGRSGRGDGRPVATNRRDSDADGFGVGEDEGDGGGCDVTLLYGKPYIHDVLHGLTFRISPRSFFQTNSAQAAVLYDIVRQAAGLRPGAADAVLDLYCGTGAIGLCLAAQCRQVVGMEVVDSAVSDARRNAALNGISNAAFVCADVDRVPRLDALLAQQHQLQQHQHRTQHPAQPSQQEGPQNVQTLSSTLPPPASRFAPDVVIVDPARAGLSPLALSFLLGGGFPSARRLVYVSCNVATQARDLDRLCNGPSPAFRLVSVQPVDMFPHTDHVETVAVLNRIAR